MCFPIPIKNFFLLTLIRRVQFILFFFCMLLDLVVALIFVCILAFTLYNLYQYTFYGEPRVIPALPHHTHADWDSRRSTRPNGRFNNRGE